MRRATSRTAVFSRFFYTNCVTHLLLTALPIPIGSLSLHHYPSSRSRTACTCLRIAVLLHRDHVFEPLSRPLVQLTSELILSLCRCSATPLKQHKLRGPVGTYRHYSLKKVFSENLHCCKLEIMAEVLGESKPSTIQTLSPCTCTSSFAFSANTDDSSRVTTGVASTAFLSVSTSLLSGLLDCSAGV